MRQGGRREGGGSGREGTRSPAPRPPALSAGVQMLRSRERGPWSREPWLLTQVHLAASCLSSVKTGIKFMRLKEDERLSSGLPWSQSRGVRAVSSARIGEHERAKCRWDAWSNISDSVNTEHLVSARGLYKRELTTPPV